MAKVEFNQRAKKLGHSTWVLIPNHILKNELPLTDRQLIKVTIEEIEQQNLKADQESSLDKAVYVGLVERNNFFDKQEEPLTC